MMILCYAKIDKRREHRSWLKKDRDGHSTRHFSGTEKLFQMFHDDAAAERWFDVKQRWPNRQSHLPACTAPRFNTYAVIPSRKPMPYRCKDCRKRFSVRKWEPSSGFQPAQLDSQVGIAIYMMTVGIKGTSSMRLHRDLKIDASHGLALNATDSTSLCKSLATRFPVRSKWMKPILAGRKLINMRVPSSTPVVVGSGKKLS